MKRKGFTLIELLVVIAIIAVLISILFPVFSRAREQSRKTVCSNNLKQIYFAFRMYAEDYDGWFPGKVTTGTGLPYGNWPVLLTGAGYAKGPGITPKPWNTNVAEMFFCPSDTTRGNYQGRNNGFTSYGLNGSWESDTAATRCYWVDGNNYWVSSQIFDNNVAKVLLGDAGANVIVDGRTLPSRGAGLMQKDNFWTGHNGTGNLLFTDGHVEASSRDTTGNVAKSARFVWSYYYDKSLRF